jgi:hypothetical protein
MMKQELTIVFVHESTSPIRAWELIAAYLKERGLEEDQYEIVDVPVPFEDVTEHLKRRGKPHFGIKGKRFSFYLSVVGGSPHDALRVDASGSSDWGGWVQQLKEAGNFVHAFVVDTEYDFWQNAQDPLEYESNGRSFDHLPMISNGLPFPLEQEVVDTSKNPGRRVLREGFIEAIGSPMWLGDLFWGLTGASKDALPKDGVVVEEEYGLTKVCIGDGITDQTDRGIQETLRQSLFPECVEG